MVLPRYSHLLASLIPNARFKIYPDAAHGFLFQHHAEFAADVRLFLGDGGASANRSGHDEARGGRRASPRHPGCTHWVAEEGPEVTLAALTAFLAPYQKNRDSTSCTPPKPTGPEGTRRLHHQPTRR